jgi:molecular chaperone Hsp33
MIEEDRGAEVSCRFCDQIYQFTEEDLRVLQKAATMREDEDE